MAHYVQRVSVADNMIQISTCSKQILEWGSYLQMCLYCSSVRSAQCLYMCYKMKIDFQTSTFITKVKISLELNKDEVALQLLHGSLLKEAVKHGWLFSFF